MRNFKVSLFPAGLAMLTGIAASGPSYKQCVQLKVPLPITATNYQYSLPRIDSNIDAVDWIWNLSTWSHQDANGHVIGVVPVNTTFTISAQLCVPPHGNKSDILQIATHGIGFDKRYWDVEIKPDEYSYVSAALDHGYSILTYDRLGTGESSKSDAYTMVQAGVEIEIVRSLTELARAGKLTSAKVIKSSHNDTGAGALNDFVPRKVVHVGHSYGSFMTSGLLARYGNMSDGAILTGFLINPHLLNEVGPAAFGYEFARESDPSRFEDRPSGYLVQKTKSNIQQIFLKKGTFEPELLSYAERIKQPNTVGELVSGAQAFGQPATDFKGPIQIIVGENDYPVCDGDCNNSYNLDNITALYPVASKISVYLQPGTGHGLTLSTNATAGYDVIFSFLDRNNL